MRFWKSKGVQGKIDAVPPPPPRRQDPWEGEWDGNSLKCPACGNIGETLTFNTFPMLRCSAAAFDICRVYYYMPTRPEEVPK